MPTGPYAAEIMAGIAHLNQLITIDLRDEPRDESVIRMSEAGKCARYLGYKLLGHRAEVFSDRLRGIFNAGHVFEQLVLAGMRVAGLPVESAQYELTSDDPPQMGHFDGRTVIDEVACVLEVKSANANRFQEMVRRGVRASDPEYWVQMQVYMHHADLTSAFYVAICKDNSDIYTELVEYDAEFMEALNGKLRQIWALTRRGELPDPEFNKASRQCQRCPFATLCPGMKGRRGLLIVG